jgi:hypothetical protein
VLRGSRRQRIEATAVCSSGDVADVLRRLLLRDTGVMSHDSPRLLLDTNVWRYLVDARQVQELRKATKQSAVEVVVAPGVVYELLRTRDAPLRRELARAVTLGWWTRLMPEAFEQSQAIVRVIRRRRPEWLRENPDLANFYRLRSDWQGNLGFWKRARRTPQLEAKVISTLERDVLERADAEARQRRADLKALPFDRMKLTGWSSRPARAIPGWEGTDVAPWRFETLDVWWAGLLGRTQQAYVDWTEPFLDLRAIGAARASWNHLWLHEVHSSEVPREWLRWGVGLLQGTRSVKGGTPGDNQIATYLVDAEKFVTADKVFADIARVVARDAAFPVAETHLLRTPEDPMSVILAVLARESADA